MSTKKQVLKMLYEADGFVSGENISLKLGLSRAAVNMAVKGLRADGYGILSVTNRGYRLDGMPDSLDELAVSCFVSGGRAKLIRCFSEIDSTNTELAREAALGAADRQVVIADMQTGGKGRKGREFSSPAGSGIYLSYLIRPDRELKAKIERMGDDMAWSGITSWTAVAVSDAIRELTGVCPGIKWVNDLYLNGRKLCGILTQMRFEGESGDVDSIIIGIGINCHETYGDFPEEIRDIAGSLLSETGERVARAQLAACVVAELDRMYDNWPDERLSYITAYRERSIVAGRDVTLIRGDTPEKVHVIGMDDDFELIVRMGDGSIQRLMSGDISLRL